MYAKPQSVPTKAVGVVAKAQSPIASLTTAQSNYSGTRHDYQSYYSADQTHIVSSTSSQYSRKTPGSLSLSSDMSSSPAFSPW